MTDTREFDGRSAMGRRAEQLAERYFESKGYDYDRTAVEVLYQPEVRRQISDLTATYPLLRHVRYAPDYRVRRPDGVCHVDAKATEAVERQCFQHYLTLDATEPVYLFLPHTTDKLLAI